MSDKDSLRWTKPVWLNYVVLAYVAKFLFNDRNSKYNIDLNTSFLSQYSLFLYIYITITAVQAFKEVNWHRKSEVHIFLYKLWIYNSKFTYVFKLRTFNKSTITDGSLIEIAESNAVWKVSKYFLKSKYYPIHCYISFILIFSFL